jgi:hypothetical protein
MKNLKRELIRAKEVLLLSPVVFFSKSDGIGTRRLKGFNQFLLLLGSFLKWWTRITESWDLPLGQIIMFAF